ncbi:hypothetical protein ER308_11575 [Egibacter rhizosphaerae]|uniref:Uncharacterized protein n=1 Tax=Egibacter rhizosphaerae TaxID=1670831 RepID=A0A411YG34_9ACTN|nr:hypothetical protein [Egibacter rhizosphaerae]QBI20139.1 hypothetical protein ER308_11575 [Egibacter rhizosphaerae]
MGEQESERLRALLRTRAQGVSASPDAVDDVRRRARRQDAVRRGGTAIVALAVLAVALPVGAAQLPMGDEGAVVLDDEPSAAGQVEGQAPPDEPREDDGDGANAEADEDGTGDTEPAEDGDGAGAHDAPASDAGDTDTPLAEWEPETCTDEAAGLEIRYPGDWETAELVDGTPCRLFDPEPIDVGEQATDDVDAAVVVDVLADDLDTFLERRGTEGAEVEHAEFEGREAVRIADEVADGGLLPQGTETLTWAVALDGDTTVVLSASDHPDRATFEAAREIVDGMAASVRPQRDAEEEAGCSAEDVERVAPAERDALPEPAAQTRTAILEASRACDVERLAELASAERFVATEGLHDPDPASTWRALEREGAEPLALLADLLAGPPAQVRQDGEIRYEWPLAFSYGSWDDIPAEEREAAQAHFDDEEIAHFRERRGTYLGTRVTITAEGEWIAFAPGEEAPGEEAPGEEAP